MIVVARQSVHGVGCCAGWRSSRTALSFQGGSPSVALDVHLEDGRVVDEAVDHGQGHGGIGEDLAPLTERLVCGDEDGAAFVAGTDEARRKGAPDESGSRRREKGLARAGNARVRRGMIQLAWRFLMFQKDSALAEWYRQRTENARGTRKTMIVALARKLLIALWRLVTTGVVPEGVRLRPAA